MILLSITADKIQYDHQDGQTVSHTSKFSLLPPIHQIDRCFPLVIWTEWLFLLVAFPSAISWMTSITRSPSSTQTGNGSTTSSVECSKALVSHQLLGSQWDGYSRSLTPLKAPIAERSFKETRDMSPGLQELTDSGHGDLRLPLVSVPDDL